MWSQDAIGLLKTMIPVVRRIYGFVGVQQPLSSKEAFEWMNSAEKVIKSGEDELLQEKMLAATRNSTYGKFSREVDPKFYALVALTGFVENGSDVTVKLFHDDATRTKHINVGKKTYWGNSWGEVLAKAIEDNKETDAAST